MSEDFETFDEDRDFMDANSDDDEEFITPNKVRLTRKRRDNAFLTFFL